MARVYMVLIEPNSSKQQPNKILKSNNQTKLSKHKIVQKTGSHLRNRSSYSESEVSFSCDILSSSWLTRDSSTHKFFEIQKFCGKKLKTESDWNAKSSAESFYR